MSKVVPQKELDVLLDSLVSDPESFDRELDGLVARFDREGTDLEIVDSSSWWRDAGRTSRVRFTDQLRADVDSILTLDREDEARLARRLEFARLRLARANEADRGSSGSVHEGGVPVLVDKPVSTRAQRRALELHSLRVEMVERNLYLVLINAERYAGSGSNRADLIQEGCVSLFRAVDGFDWKRGLLFRTYAVHWLNQAFRNYLYNHGHTVRVPIYLQKALKHINQATIRLGKEQATPDEIAASSDLNPKLVRSALAAARKNFSIDARLSDSEGSRLGDLIEDESAIVGYTSRVEDISLESGLTQALDCLDGRESQVLKMRFGIDCDKEHTLAEVAAHFGVSVERVRQIQVRAIGKLDTPTLRRELEPFLN